MPDTLILDTLGFRVAFVPWQRADVGLSSQLSTIDFKPVRPEGTDRELWMPREVKVEILYRGVKIRNVHQYSNYRLFRVESTIHP